MYNYEEKAKEFKANCDFIAANYAKLLKDVAKCSEEMVSKEEYDKVLGLLKTAIKEREAAEKALANRIKENKVLLEQIAKCKTEGHCNCHKNVEEKKNEGQIFEIKTDKNGKLLVNGTEYNKMTDKEKAAFADAITKANEIDEEFDRMERGMNSLFKRFFY